MYVLHVLIHTISWYLGVITILALVNANVSPRCVIMLLQQMLFHSCSCDGLKSTVGTCVFISPLFGMHCFEMVTYWRFVHSFLADRTISVVSIFVQFPVIVQGQNWSVNFITISALERQVSLLKVIFIMNLLSARRKAILIFFSKLIFRSEFQICSKSRQ